MAPHALPHHLDRRQSHNYDIPKTYKGGDQGHGAAKDDEERLDADVVLQRVPGVKALIMIFVFTLSLRFDLLLPASPSLSCS